MHDIVAARCHKDDPTVRPLHFFWLWRKHNIGRPKPKPKEVYHYGAEFAVRFETEGEVEEYNALKIRIDESHSLELKKYSPQVHSTVAIEKTSLVPQDTIVSALMSAFPRVNFTMWRRFQNTNLRDKYYVVFEKPPSRIVKRVYFPGTEGNNGKNWSSKVLVEEVCSACGSGKGHSAQSPCENWLLIGTCKRGVA